MGAGLMRRLVSSRIPQLMSVLMLSQLAVGQPVTVSASTPTCTTDPWTAHGFDSAAISNGTLYMWGNNGDGQLGVGFRGGLHSTPLPVLTSTGLVSPTAVWTSGGSSYSVDASGQLWGWGDNHFGELAKPTTVTSYPSPAQIAAPSHIVQVSAGSGILAVTPDGNAWGWGMSSFGELGFVQSTPQITPVVLPGLSNVVQVAAGSFTSVALTRTGTVYGAGQNLGGELGLGAAVTQSNTFQPLPGLSNITQVAISESGFFSAFVVAVDQSGHVFTAGNNQDGEMGTGSASSTNQLAFAQVPNLDNVVAVSAGDLHVLALKRDGTVWAWGGNPYGALGNGTLNDSATPTQVSFPAGTELVDMEAGFLHSMALDSNGNLWSWGMNSFGELGTGTGGGFKTTPVKVSLGPVGPSCAPPPPKKYDTSVNGYSFVNDGGITAPSYDRMASFYPKSSGEMFYSLPFGITTESIRGAVFYNGLFKPFYVGYPQPIGGGGLCYGMVVSNQFLFSHFPDKSAYSLYSDGLHSQFPGALGASPSPSDTTIEQFIDRYHSRQLAASGVLASIQSWNTTENTGGNRAAFAVVAAAVAAGKTEWLGLGPARSLLSQGAAGKARFATLFNASHAVLAYAVNTDPTNEQISIYDPNDPFDPNLRPNAGQDHIQIVDVPGVPGGGIQLVHGDGSVSFGGGTATSDSGLPQEWTLMPLPEEAFTDAGIIPNQDNLHWVLDSLPAVASAIGVKLPSIGGIPVFRINDTNVPAQAVLEQLPDGTGFNETVSTIATGAQTLQITGSHVAQVTETDATAAGTLHQVSLSSDASQIVLSNASTVQQFSMMLGSDFLPTFGRRMTISGATLMPGGTLDMSTDPTYSTLNLPGSAMPAQQTSLVLEQVGQGAGVANVTATIPGTGARSTVFIGDWSALSASLIFEVVIGADGSVSGLLLQDNPGQRQQLAGGLLQSIQAGINQVSDAGIRNSLQSKWNNASKQVTAGDPATAANVLVALEHEVAAQNGLTIPSDLAASVGTSLTELIGLLRTTSA
jgi:alpha-tubulin suppressor-like RCC1 family protein